MKSIIEEASSIIKAIEKGWASAGKPTEFTVKVLEQPAYNFLGFNTKPAKISFFFDDRTITATIEKQTQARHGTDTRQKPLRQSDYGKTQRRDGEQTQPKHQQARQPDARAPRREHERAERPEQRTPQQKKQSDFSNQRHTAGSGDTRTNRRDNEERAQVNAQHGARQEIEKKETHVAPVKEPRTPQVTWNPETQNLAKEWVQQFLGTIQKGHIAFTAHAQNHILKIDFSGPITSNNQKEIMLFKNAAHLLMSSLRNVTNSELKQLKVVFSTSQG